MNGLVVGVPSEVRAFEGRVALTPQAVSSLKAAGSDVLIQQGAGLLSGFDDHQYHDAGAEMVSDAFSLYQRAELIVKVKEPQRSEIPLLRRGQLLFCYLHLAADLELMALLAETGLTAIAFETVEVDGRLPLLAPMSAIAGKLSVQIGTRLLHQPQGGKGLLLGGVDGVEPGRVVILGGGVAGEAALSVASGIGAEVTLLERTERRIEILKQRYPGIEGVLSSGATISDHAAGADLLIGAVLLKGARAPKLVSKKVVAQMGAGSVVIDISVDQGGCIETIRPTTYQSPTYTVDGVTHFGVTNMPGAVPRTASQALSAAILPWVIKLSQDKWREMSVLTEAINIDQGEVVYPALKTMI